MGDKAGQCMRTGCAAGAWYVDAELGLCRDHAIHMSDDLRRDLESRISEPSEHVPDGSEDACGKCGGEGFVMVPIASASGFPTERRERCATCNGVGAKRCNAEGRAGDLCKLVPGHGGEHKSERGVKWDEGGATASGVWHTLMNHSGKWFWERAAFGFAKIEWEAGREVKASDHFCAQGYPSPPDLESRYAIFCGRDRKWIDVTDVVVRGFVVPYEEHVVIPKAEESPAAPRPSSDPEPLGDIVSRILRDLRALVRVASK